MKTEFPDPDDILNFTLTIEPDEGMYRDGRFTFTFSINQNFPHDPPKVLCQQKIYHPNIDLEGKVCLNILREDWKPVLNLNAVIVGLQVSYLLRLPHPSYRGPDNQSRGASMLNGYVFCPGKLVSLPRTKRIRPPEQGSSGRPTA